ncbi:hypothetical protein [Nocardia goodfellowii]|uniref:Uncharacterized protein n=1 Tax=Nocardia goodfellowii TaxID=882446 RepID=A0ABS4QRH1_9NOCA|nr:hypothetical protein [Nocardia goodfellowii]MBP2194313.1 hypothetical protein [Nocardia goodfellowii]
MGASMTDRVMNLIISQLTEVLAADGFVRCPAPDGKGEAEPGERYPTWRRAWFAATGDVEAGLNPTIMAHLLRGDGGSVGVSGWASVMSDAVAQIRAELPPLALESAASRRVPADLEGVSFGQFQYPQHVGMATIWITLESDVDYCVDRFMDSVRGPVQQWFAQRATVPGLVAMATAPTLSALDRSNPDPVRLRGAVILALLGGHIDEAVTLMDWYKRRDQFHAWDSAERVEAFDAAMSTRFPEYAAARRG